MQQQVENILQLFEIGRYTKEEARRKLFNLFGVTKIYLVLLDNGGAHEDDNVASVWDNIEDAKKEVDRWNKQRYEGYGAGYKEIELNKSYDNVHCYSDDESKSYIIASETVDFISKGRNYELIETEGVAVYIIDDSGDRNYYRKSSFII